MTQSFHEVATPATNSNPYGITVDASNDVWFTENTDAVALIGEYTANGTLNEYKIRNTQTGGTGLTPHLITIAPNGTVWWSEGWVSAIGTLNPAAAQPGTNNGVTEYSYTPSCPSCGSHTSGIRLAGEFGLSEEGTMDTSKHKLAVAGGTMLAVICLLACGSTTNPGSGSATTVAPAAPAATPRQVTPKNGGGSPGQGPLVVSGPASLPGRDHQVVLRDRTLIITSVTRHPGPAHGSVLIDLNLVVRNTSGRPIKNIPAFFQLIGPEGDSFNYQYKSSDNFYRPIGARTSRAGLTEFEIPAAAAASLSLLYRPEVARDTALIQLNVR